MIINKSQINYLKELSLRLSGNGFSWNHEDYFQLKKIVPEILCHLCLHGDKNDGFCWDCFNEKNFKYYLKEKK